MSAILVVNLTITLAQTDDTSDADKAGQQVSSFEEDPTKLQGIDNDSVESSTIEKVDLSTKVEIQRIFNELRKEYLDDRSEYIDMWLAVIAIVLTFFAIVVAIAGYIGFREFRRLRDEAREDVKEIKSHLTGVLASAAELEKIRSEEESEININSHTAIQNLRESFGAETFTSLFNDEEFESNLIEFEQIPNLSIVDKAMIDAYKFQKDGKINRAIHQWRSIAIIVSETDKDLTSRAWCSVGYLLSNKELFEKAISAYDNAIGMNADDADAYYNRGMQKLELEQYQPALEDFDRAIQLNLKSPDVYIGRGIARIELNMTDDAFIDFEIAISINPNYPTAYAIQGEAKALHDDLTNAKMDLQKALQLARDQGNEELCNMIEERLQELNELK